MGLRKECVVCCSMIGVVVGLFGCDGSKEATTTIPVTASAPAAVATTQPAVRTEPVVFKPAGEPKVVPKPVPAAQPKPLEPGAHYRCDEPTYELVNVWSGDRVKHTFVIHNDGDKPLEIINVQSACGCMVADNYTRSVEPGGRGEIPVTLATAPGRDQVHKEMMVQTNDPKNASNKLTIQGKLTPRIRVEPNVGANWGRYMPGSVPVMIVKLTNNFTQAMKLELLPSNKPDIFEATVKETEPGKLAELTVTAKTPIPEGSHMGEFVLKTGFSDEPTLTVPATLLLPPVLETRAIAFSELKSADQEDRQTVAIEYNREGTMKLQSVTPSDPNVKVDQTEKEPGHVFHLVITLPPGFKPANNEKQVQVVVMTDVPTMPKVVIPIQVRGLEFLQPPAK